MFLKACAKAAVFFVRGSRARSAGGSRRSGLPPGGFYVAEAVRQRGSAV